VTALPARPDGPRGSGSHIAVLDGLRGLAILMVMFVHFVGDETPRTAVERAIVKLANYGVWGVDLFFVLSGFLITGILYDAKTSPHYFRNFYVRRTLRIFPLYYGFLAVLFVVLPALPVPYPSGLADAARHQAWLWTYTTNVYLAGAGSWALPYVSHFWSLAVEEHFYLLWPIVVLSCGRSALLKVCVAGVAVSLVLRCALSFAGASAIALVVLTPCRLDALCVGAFAALAVRTVGLGRVAHAAAPSLLALSALTVLVSAANATLSSLQSVALPVRGTLVALTFGALLVTSVAAPRTSSTSRVLRSRAMRFFGKYSYSLYVFHGVVALAFQEHRILDAAGAHLLAMGARATVGVAVSLLLAIGSYELFERHFLRLKDRFAPAERPTSLGAVATTSAVA
jgi:peptidoglycan/LPS O-acetylase OafA/YrhL